MTRSPLVIAAASGFWGDRNDALLDQVQGGPVDVVMLDYLAEVTMSILRVKKHRDPHAGYATDFLRALEPALPSIAERRTKIVTNAGGMNPRACGEAVCAVATRLGIRDIAVGVVTGDDVFDRLPEIVAGGSSLEHLDTGAAFSSIRERVLSANVYLGADPIAEALRRGADIVVTGRCTDSALALGPLLAHFDWAQDDWDRRAAGTVAGHVLECGGQASGGNFAGGWERVPDLERLGYPIAVVEASGEFVVTKHASLGGLVDRAVITEQLVYEIGDPRAYATPDVVADFTSIRLEDLGENRVRVFGVKGAPAPHELKVSITFHAGYRNVAMLTFVWPKAKERALRTAELVLARCRALGLTIDAHNVELLGVSAAHGAMAPPPATEPNEVGLRLAIRTSDETSARRFGYEIAPLLLDGLPGAAAGPGFGGRPEPQRIVDHWPALVPRALVRPQVEVLCT
jgi:hypothetical protein